MSAAPLQDTVHVIGMGEVGTRLANALEAAGSPVNRVTRSDGWEAATADTPGLRVVCVREGEALRAVTERLAGQAGERMVFVQNGWIRPDLEAFPGHGRGLIWFTSKGDFFCELRPSPFSGPAVPALVDALSQGGLAVSPVTDEDELRRLEADKMGFNAVVGLPLAVHGVDLATYLGDFSDEAEALFVESVTATSSALDVEPDPMWWPVFVESVEPLGWMATSKAKHLDERNGAVARLGREVGVPTPVTDQLLTAVGYTP